MDILHDKGLSVSYHRVKEVSTEIANTVLDEYDRTGIVCPPNPNNGLYTSGNLDNIDHNPQSVTSNDAFHGTAIYVTQHVFEDSVHTESACLNIQTTQSKTVIKSLPEMYKDAPPVALKTTTPRPNVHEYQGHVTRNGMAGICLEHHRQCYNKSTGLLVLVCNIFSKVVICSKTAGHNNTLPTVP